MADNATLPASGRNVATDQVTYSGDVADVQLVRLVDVTGAEGSKTVTVPSFAVTGPVTDTQLRATAVPVAPNITRGAGIGDANTQRVTLASDGPAVTALTSIDTKTLAAGQALMAASSPVVIASNQGAIPVIGTFFQATQPVSIAATVATTVTSNGVISTANSTTTVLAANAVLTGTSEDISEFAHIIVSLFASHVSATDGVQLQQSLNGTDWDLIDAYTLPATTGKTFSAPVQGKFFRIVFTNGATAQTVFRLQTIFSKQTKKGSSVRPQDGRSNENDFDEVLAYGMGWNGTTWDRIKSTTGALNVVQTDVSTSGNLAAAAQTVVLALVGNNAAAAQITGTWVGTITFEASLDGTNWTGINAVSASTSTPQTTTTVNGLYRLTPGGLQQIRANMSAFTSGTATVLMRASAGAGGTFANQILPTRNTDGTSTQTIKPASTAAVAADQAAVVALHPSSPLPTGANTIGAVTGPAAAPLSLDSTQTNHTQRLQSVTTLTTLSAANTAVTLTLPAVAAQFHYITRIRISMHNTSAAAVVGSAVTLAFSSTNIPGALAWTEGNALAAGISKLVCDEVLTNSIKSSVVNTASTIVAPACGAGVLVRITAYYYTAA